MVVLRAYIQKIRARLDAVTLAAKIDLLCVHRTGEKVATYFGMFTVLKVQVELFFRNLRNTKAVGRVLRNRRKRERLTRRR